MLLLFMAVGLELEELIHSLAVHSELALFVAAELFEVVDLL